MQSRLLRIEGILNSNHYIREVLQPEVLPLLQATPHAIFQQDNARPHVTRFVQAFFQGLRVSLLSWLARSPNMSLIEHVWDMVGRRCFVRVLQHLVLMLCGLAYKLQGGTFPRKIFRASLIPYQQCIETLIAVHGGFTPY